MNVSKKRLLPEVIEDLKRMDGRRKKRRNKAKGVLNICLKLLDRA